MKEEQEPELQVAADIRTYTVIGILLLTSFTLGITISLQESSFRYVVVGNSSSTDYGYVFACLDVPPLLTSIFFGSFLSEIGPRRMLLSGLFLKYLTTLLFGCITFITNQQLLLCVFILCEIISGLEKTLIKLGSIATILVLYESKAGTLIALCESMYCVAHVMLPVIAGMSPDLGMVFLPVLLLSFWLFLLVFLTFVFFPIISYIREEPFSRKQKLLSVMNIYQLWLLPVAASIMTAYFGFLLVALEPSLDSMKLSSSVVGALFGLPVLTFAIFAPIWGILCDVKLQPVWLMVLGSLVAFSGSAVLGVPDVIPQETNVITVIVGLVLVGVGGSGLYAPTVIQMEKIRISRNIFADPDVHGAMTSMFLTVIFVGGVTGPVVGGMLFQLIGYRNANSIFSFLLLLALVLSIVFLYQQNYQRRDSESDITTITTVLDTLKSVDSFNPNEQIDQAMQARKSIGSCSAASEFSYPGSKHSTLEMVQAEYRRKTIGIIDNKEIMSKQSSKSSSLLKPGKATAKAGRKFSKVGMKSSKKP